MFRLEIKVHRLGEARNLRPGSLFTGRSGAGGNLSVLERGGSMKCLELFVMCMISNLFLSFIMIRGLCDKEVCLNIATSSRK